MDSKSPRRVVYWKFLNQNTWSANKLGIKNDSKNVTNYEMPMTSKMDQTATK